MKLCVNCKHYYYSNAAGRLRRNLCYFHCGFYTDIVTGARMKGTGTTYPCEAMRKIEKPWFFKPPEYCGSEGQFFEEKIVL